MRKEQPKGGAKITQVASQVKRFEETHAAANMEAFRPGEFTRIVIIEQHCICMDFLRQENCAELSYTQSILLLGRQQVRLILKFFHFDPLRFLNFRSSGQAGTRDDHFVVNFSGDVKAWKEPIQEFEAAELRQNDQRG